MTIRNRLRRSNKYRLLGLVGQGQFGQVFCAVHRKTGQIVALKNLDHARFPTHKFLRELRFLLSLQHPNIVNCQSLEHTATGRYLVMDYCEAGTLRQLITSEISLSLAQKLDLISDVLQGLRHAHDRGIIHCDIKPENILLTVKPGGWIASVSDFGIARLAHNESLAAAGNTGSPAYMAPERFYGQYSALSDLYAVGVMLYELVLGLRPFSGTPQELMLAHMNKTLQVPEQVPADLRQILTTALQKIPARRFHSAADMLAAIHAVDPQGTIAPYRSGNAEEPGWVNRWQMPPTPISPWLLYRSSTKLCAIATQPPASPDPTASCGWRVVTSTTHITGWVTAPAPREPVAATAEVGVPPPVSLPPSRLDTAATDHLTSAAPPPLAQFQFTMPRSHQIKALTPHTCGCFVTTSQTISLLPWVALPQDRPQDRPQVPAAHTLIRIEDNSYAAIQPGARWVAALTLLSDHRLRLTICRWRVQRGEQPLELVSVLSRGQTIPGEQLLGRPRQLLPLSDRYFALMTTQLHPQTQTPKGTQFNIYTRRGTWVSQQQVTLPLAQAVPTQREYQFLATEATCPEAIVLITLKPWRVQRILLSVRPVCYVALDWGYAIAAEDGQILLLNESFELVGRLAGPPHPTAIAGCGRDRLLVAAAIADSSDWGLYEIDLRTCDLDLLF